MRIFTAKAFACAAALSFALSACDSPLSTRPAAAYNPTALTNGLYYRWASGSIVKVWVVQAGLTTTADLEGAVSRALPVWNTVPQYNEVQLIAATSAAEANIIVYDASVPMPVVPPATCAFDARGAGGYTYFCDGKNIEGADNALVVPLTTGGGVATVVIRVDRSRVSTAAAYDAIVAHEFGHALGIGAHSDSATDLMFINPSITAPSERDKATLRFVLGQAPQLRL